MKNEVCGDLSRGLLGCDAV